jgi:hypothetical protein
MNAELKRVRNEFLMFVGLAVIVLLIGGAIVWGVYGVIGELTNEGRHILATGLVFAVPGAYALGLQIAKSHRAGIERGLDMKIGARERVQQSARPTVTPGPVVSPAARFDDVLPQVKRANIIVRADDSQSSIDI